MSFREAARTSRIVVDAFLHSLYSCPWGFWLRFNAVIRIIVREIAGLINSALGNARMLMHRLLPVLATLKTYLTDPQRAEEGIKLVLREGKVATCEPRARGKDGRETVVSYNASTFDDRKPKAGALRRMAPRLSTAHHAHACVARQEIVAITV